MGTVGQIQLVQAAMCAMPEQVAEALKSAQRRRST